MNIKSKKNISRITIYCIGMIILAMGLTLNAQTHLGVAPVMSMPYSLSVILGKDYGNVTLIVYVIFVFIEILIHLYLKQHRDIIVDLFQIAFSLVFTRFLNIFKDRCPDFLTDLSGSVWGSMPSRILFLGLGIVLTGVGAAMMLNSRIIPNPADGMVQAFSDLTKKDIGLVKNCLDAVCVSITCVMSFTLSGSLVGIGIGTLLSLIGVGRVIATYNRLVLSPLPVTQK
ncbi:putative membrane protein [Lachnospiraceae bacterium JC7]|nr:putative membrane protein [Lachnospiraceae bacterium JC7]